MSSALGSARQSGVFFGCRTGLGAFDGGGAAGRGRGDRSMEFSRAVSAWADAARLKFRGDAASPAREIRSTGRGGASRRGDAPAVGFAAAARP